MNLEVESNYKTKTDKSLMTYSNDFRLYLQNELVKRCKNNPKYSLRAFASFLEVDPSFLSKVLSKKRRLTKQTIHSFALRLGIDPQMTESFILAQNADSKHNNEYAQISLDHFRLISDWYHYAIIELISVDHFEPNEKWISKSLGITQAEVKAALERLFRLNLIEVTVDGSWKNCSGNNSTVSNDFTDVAFRKLQKSVLEKAITALEEISYEHRDQTSMTLATDPSLLPEAKIKIMNFRRELTKFLESTSNKTAVFNLGISLYPISKIDKKLRSEHES